MSLEDNMLIENFLNDSLSEGDKRKMIARMKDDVAFRKKVFFEQQLFSNLDNEDWDLSKNPAVSDEIKEYEQLFKDTPSQELKATLATVNKKYQKKQNKGTTPWLLYAGVAVIVFFIGLTVFLQTNNQNSPQELYAVYFDVSEVPSLLHRGSDGKRSLINAQKLFEDKKYDQALHILTNELIGSEKNKAAIYLYTGISQMELGMFDAAAITFDTLIHSKLIDAPKGIWYKALLFLKMGEREKTREMLQRITQSSDNYKFKEATELLESL